MHTYITSAVWSNTRPALFFLGYDDGSIEMWDLLHSIYEPFLIRFVSATSVTAMSMQSLSGNCIFVFFKKYILLAYEGLSQIFLIGRDKEIKSHWLLK